MQYGTSEKSKSSGDIAVLRMGNITRKGTIDYSDLVYTSNKADIEKLRLKAGDILFNRTNSSEWVGKTAIYRGEVPSIYAGYIIRMTPIFLDCEYVNMVMNSQYERDWCNFVKTDGVNQSNINSQKLGQFYIPIPPIEEQKRIVETGNYWLHLVESIESNKKDIINTITKAKQEVLRKAICGELVSQDPADEPAIELLRHINPNIQIPCDNPHYPFDIPQSWCWVHGNQVFAPMQSCTPKGNTFKYIDIDTIDNKNNNILAAKILPTKDAPSRASRFTMKDDTLFSMVRPYLRNIAMVQEDDCIASTGFYVCRSNGSLLAKYCFYMMLSSYVVDGLNFFMKGDNSPSINRSHIESFLYPLPSLAEQKRIVSEIERYFNALDKIKESLTA